MGPLQRGDIGLMHGYVIVQGRLTVVPHAQLRCFHDNREPPAAGHRPGIWPISSRLTHLVGPGNVRASLGDGSIGTAWRVVRGAGPWQEEDDIDGTTEPSDLLAGQATQVAPLLLGAHLTAYSDQGAVSVEITEVEAYEGATDPASHAWRGMTARTTVMFGAAGHLYVYRSHGLHWCMNVVTGPTGSASAVLLRAGRVITGHDLARTRRGSHLPDWRLARGPGCLAQALGVTGALNGTDLTAGEGPLLLSLPGGERPPIVSGPRVGVSRADAVPWRWWVPGDRTVSAYRRSPRAGRG